MLRAKVLRLLQHIVVAQFGMSPDQVGGIECPLGQRIGLQRIQVESLHGPQRLVPVPLQVRPERRPPGLESEYPGCPQPVEIFSCHLSLPSPTTLHSNS